MKGINLIGYTKRELGIGEAFKLNIEAFKTTNIPFDVYDIESGECINGNKTDYNINLFQVSPLSILTIGKSFKKEFYKKKYNILFAAWESEYLPIEAQENLKFFDEIWCPSKFCQSILSKYFRGSVINIPHPVQIEIANRNFKERYNSNKISFLSVFDYNSSIERKNILGLIDSFEGAFGKKNNDIELILKTSNCKKNKKEAESVKKAISEIDYIKKIDDYLSREELDNLIYKCDSYISLHRSEGFGLTMAEAMFLEKPVIGTGYSGNLEFMNSFNSFLVDFEITKNKKNDNNYDKNIIWAEPSIKSASIRLKSIASNYDSAKKVGIKGSIDIKNNFSYKVIGQLINQRLNFIMDDFSNIKNDEHMILELKSELELNKRELMKLKNIFFVKIFLFLKKIL